jgi:hypothetical protein
VEICRPHSDLFNNQLILCQIKVNASLYKQSLHGKNKGNYLVPILWFMTKSNTRQGVCGRCTSRRWISSTMSLFRVTCLLSQWQTVADTNTEVSNILNKQFDTTERGLFFPFLDLDVLQKDLWLEIILWILFEENLSWTRKWVSGREVIICERLYRLRGYY